MNDGPDETTVSYPGGLISISVEERLKAESLVKLGGGKIIGVDKESDSGQLARPGVRFSQQVAHDLR